MDGCPTTPIQGSDNEDRQELMLMEKPQASFIGDSSDAIFFSLRESKPAIKRSSTYSKRQDHPSEQKNSKISISIGSI
jgi:hypothetical protein